MKNGWPKPQPLNVAHQLNDLIRLYPKGNGRVFANHLIWEGHLKPSNFSRTYKIKIEYQIGKYPKTLVTNPQLRILSGGKKPPHVYNEPGDPLCIFYPHAREWNSTMLISRTIIPWAAEWLLHFEAWLFTGQWEGGGIEHEPTNIPQAAPA
jgi:hypothetical protein